MKKITPILLLAISLLLVCACSHDKNTTSTDHELDSLRIEMIDSKRTKQTLTLLSMCCRLVWIVLLSKKMAY